MRCFLSAVPSLMWPLALVLLCSGSGAAGLAVIDGHSLAHGAPDGKDFALDVAKVAPIRAGASRQRAKAAALRAEAAAMGAEHSAPLAADAGASPEDQAAASLKDTILWQVKAQGLLGPVEARAYAAARAAAEAKVRRMDTEAKKYFEALMAEFNALSSPQTDANEAAVAQATQPYYEAEMRLRALVESYNKKATETLDQARTLAGQARAMATKATYEQANGDAENAQKHMIQAHQTIENAEKKRGLAKRVRQLAENVNDAIPAYQQATQMAAHHAFQTLPRL